MTMDDDFGKGLTSIMHLPDDCLYFIFQWLDSSSDRESFGLTCHRWYGVQNLSRRSLQFQCSFTILNISSLSHTTTNIISFHLHRLLNRFQHLELLSLSGCTKLSDSGLSILQSYGSKLHTLCLDCCFEISDFGLNFVSIGCPSLTVISLYGCNITDAGLKNLANSCSVLKDVNLSYCSLVSDHGISALIQNCCQLRAIRISCCKNINGTGFKGCSRTLTCIEADYCKLESEGILGIVSGGGLEYLNICYLSWCRLGDDLTILGAGYGQKLRILNFRMCGTINDETIKAIANGCPLLEEWNLALCHKIKILGWESIGLNCSNLKRLHVNGCRNLCDQGLQFLRNGCRRLSVLYINRCHQITSTAIELFKCLRGDVQIKKEEIKCIAPDWAFRR